MEHPPSNLEALDRAHFFHPSTHIAKHVRGESPERVIVGGKGITIVGDRVWKVLQEGADRFGSFGHGWTYSAHPVCAAAANGNLDIVEREQLVEHAETVGEYFQQQLRAAFSNDALVGDIRGVGLLGAIEFVADRARKHRFDPALGVGARAAQECLARGLIARAMPQGDILGFAPPLVVTKSDVDRIVTIARAAIDAVSDSLAKEGAKFG